MDKFDGVDLYPYLMAIDMVYMFDREMEEQRQNILDSCYPSYAVFDDGGYGYIAPPTDVAAIELVELSEVNERKKKKYQQKSDALQYGMSLLNEEELRAFRIRYGGVEGMTDETLVERATDKVCQGIKDFMGDRESAFEEMLRKERIAKVEAHKRGVEI